MNEQAAEQPPLEPDGSVQALADAFHDARNWFQDLRRNGVNLTPVEFAADVLDRLDGSGYQLVRTRSESIVNYAGEVVITYDS